MCSSLAVTFGCALEKKSDMTMLVIVVALVLAAIFEPVDAEADPRSFTEDPFITEEKFREQGKARQGFDRYFVRLIYVQESVFTAHGFYCKNSLILKVEMLLFGHDLLEDLLS